MYAKQRNALTNTHFGFYPYAGGVVIFNRGRCSFSIPLNLQNLFTVGETNLTAFFLHNCFMYKKRIVLGNHWPIRSFFSFIYSTCVQDVAKMRRILFIMYVYSFSAP